MPYTLNKQNRIISKVKAKYWRTTHKYSVRLQKTVDDALKIDSDTGTQFWENARNKETKKAKVAYTEVDGCTSEQAQKNQVPELTGFQEILCHIVFDVKMDFTHKVRLLLTDQSQRQQLLCATLVSCQGTAYIMRS